MEEGSKVKRQPRRNFYYSDRNVEAQRQKRKDLFSPSSSFLLGTVEETSKESKKPKENRSGEKNRVKRGRRRKMKPSTGSNERISGW